MEPNFGAPRPGHVLNTNEDQEPMAIAAQKDDGPTWSLNMAVARYADLLDKGMISSDALANAAKKYQLDWDTLSRRIEKDKNT